MQFGIKEILLILILFKLMYNWKDNKLVFPYCWYNKLLECLLGFTSGAGSAYPSGTHEFTFGYK
jgi:hypothetical protein